MSREEVYLNKDEMIQLHWLLWKIKENLESSGLKFDLRKYTDFDVYAWRYGIKTTDHWHAISLLAEEMSRETVRVLRLRM